MAVNARAGQALTIPPGIFILFPMRMEPRGNVSGPRTATLTQAATLTVPVLLGYSAIGFGFGLLAVNAGYPAWFALFMSVFVFAGAAQYIGIGLFAAGAPLPEIVAVTLLVNLRHAAYGLSLLKPYALHPRLKPYLVFALTDETYALISSLTDADRENGRLLFWISALDQFYWVGGTALGALAGSLIPEPVAGLDFALTALFLVLAVEQMKTRPDHLPFLIAAACTVAASFIAGPRGTVLAGIVSATIVLAIARPRGSARASAGGDAREGGSDAGRT